MNIVPFLDGCLTLGYKVQFLVAVSRARHLPQDPILAMFFRDQLRRAATLTEEDFVQLGKCRRPEDPLRTAERRLGLGGDLPGWSPEKPLAL